MRPEDYVARVKVTCKWPPQPEWREGQLLCGIYPGLQDCEIEINGKPVVNVRAIDFSVRGSEPARVTLEFIGAEVDIDIPPVPRAVVDFFRSG